MGRRRASVADRRARAGAAAALGAGGSCVKGTHHAGPGVSLAAAAAPTGKPDCAAIFERYPCDEEGYAVGLDPADADGLRRAMRRYGVVVARVLPPTDCAAAAEEVFADCGVPRCGPPSEWETEKWPAQNRFLYGRPNGPERTAKGPAAMRNRTHPLVHRTFTALFDGEHRLWVTADTYGVMRPTVCLPFPKADGGVEFRDRPDWRWDLKMHWDCNPWALQEELDAGRPPMFQGLIALVDCSEDTGSFLAVPGCTRFFDEGWAKQPQHNHYRYAADLTAGVVNGKAYVPDKSVLRSFAQRLPLRAGDMVVWDSRTAHSNFPNTGQRFRLVQFVSMMRADPTLEERGGHWARRLIGEADIAGQDITPTGRHLLALDSWDSGTPAAARPGEAPAVYDRAADQSLQAEGVEAADKSAG